MVEKLGLHTEASIDAASQIEHLKAVIVRQQTAVQKKAESAHRNTEEIKSLTKQMDEMRMEKDAVETKFKKYKTRAHTALMQAKGLNPESQTHSPSAGGEKKTVDTLAKEWEEQKKAIARLKEIEERAKDNKAALELEREKTAALQQEFDAAQSKAAAELASLREESKRAEQQLQTLTRSEIDLTAALANASANANGNARRAASPGPTSPLPPPPSPVSHAALPSLG